MKKMILSVLMLAVAAIGRAEEPAAAPKSEWLPSFTSVKVDGPLDITFIQVPDTEAPKIVYDTKGSYTTKFRAEVKDKVLVIRERPDARRPERTSVTVRYNELNSIDITGAAATFEGVLDMPLLDMTVSDGGKFTAAMNVPDLKAVVSGQSVVTLTGTVRYLTLTLSSGRFDAVGAECLSARVYAQSKGEALLDVTDRLEARTTTGGTVRYKGNPPIIRTEARFMAGDVKPLE